MPKLIEFFTIKFHNFSFYEIQAKFNEKCLICAPSGPGLSDLENDIEYKNALIDSDVNIFDSGIFVIFLRLVKIKVNKYSGYLFLKDIINYMVNKKINNYLFIDPSIEESKKNKEYMTVLIPSNIKAYIAPFYKKNTDDYKLLHIIKTKKPRVIVINLGGGIQERLGAFIKKNIDYPAIIVCTGAAVSFLTKTQAPINNFVDKYFMGWLWRCFYNPKFFVPRYFKAIRFIPFFFCNKKTIKIINI